MVGEVESKSRNYHKNRRNNPARLVIDLSDKRNLRNKVFVFCLLDQRTEQYQQTGHENKYRQKGKHNRLDQTDTHIRADFELHEQHSRKTAHRRQRACTDLRDRLAERYDRCFANRQLPVLLLEAVT